MESPTESINKHMANQYLNERNFNSADLDDATRKEISTANKQFQADTLDTDEDGLELLRMTQKYGGKLDPRSEQVVSMHRPEDGVISPANSLGALAYDPSDAYGEKIRKAELETRNNPDIIDVRDTQGNDSRYSGATLKDDKQLAKDEDEEDLELTQKQLELQGDLDFYQSLTSGDLETLKAMITPGGPLSKPITDRDKAKAKKVAAVVRKLEAAARTDDPDLLGDYWGSEHKAIDDNIKANFAKRYDGKSLPDTYFSDKQKKIFDDLQAQKAKLEKSNNPEDKEKLKRVVSKINNMIDNDATKAKERMKELTRMRGKDYKVLKLDKAITDEQGNVHDKLLIDRGGKNQFEREELVNAVLGPTNSYTLEGETFSAPLVVLNSLRKFYRNNPYAAKIDALGPYNLSAIATDAAISGVEDFNPNKQDEISRNGLSKVENMTRKILGQRVQQRLARLTAVSPKTPEEKASLDASIAELQKALAIGAQIAKKNDGDPRIDKRQVAPGTAITPDDWDDAYDKAVRNAAGANASKYIETKLKETMTTYLKSMGGKREPKRDENGNIVYKPGKEPEQINLNNFDIDTDRKGFVEDNGYYTYVLPNSAQPIRVQLFKQEGSRAIPVDLTDVVDQEFGHGQPVLPKIIDELGEDFPTKLDKMQLPNDYYLRDDRGYIVKSLVPDMGWSGVNFENRMIHSTGEGDDFDQESQLTYGEGNEIADEDIDIPGTPLSRDAGFARELYNKLMATALDNAMVESDVLTQIVDASSDDIEGELEKAKEKILFAKNIDAGNDKNIDDLIGAWNKEFYNGSKERNDVKNEISSIRKLLYDHEDESGNVIPGVVSTLNANTNHVSFDTFSKQWADIMPAWSETYRKLVDPETPKEEIATILADDIIDEQRAVIRQARKDFSDKDSDYYRDVDALHDAVMDAVAASFLDGVPNADYATVPTLKGKISTEDEEPEDENKFEAWKSDRIAYLAAEETKDRQAQQDILKDQSNWIEVTVDGEDDEILNDKGIFVMHGKMLDPDDYDAYLAGEKSLDDIISARKKGKGKKSKKRSLGESMYAKVWERFAERV